jgi:iron complex outermembrane receptor protein
MKNNNTALALAVMTIWGAATPAMADDAMATVYVAASRSQTRITEMPLHTTIVSRAQIEMTPAQTVDQLLRDIPGMNFTAVPASASDPTGHQAKMRGLGNAKVLMLLDGVPMHDPFYLTTQWFKVPLSNIERIEILRGGNSSLWGNMAVAGVVNIVTRRPRANAGEVHASAGTQGSWNLALSRDIALADTLRLNVVADLFHTDGYQATPAQFLYRYPHKQATRAEHRNLSLTLHYQPDDSLRAYARLGYHIQDQQIAYQYGANRQESPDLAVHVEKKLPDRRHLGASIWSQYVSFDKLNGNTCYYQGGTSCLTSTSAALTTDKVNQDVVQFYSQRGRLRYRETGASLLYSTRINPVFYALTTGIDLRRLAARDQEWFYNTPASPSAPQARFDSSTAGEGVQNFRGLYGQVKAAPTEALDLTFSARLDGYRMDGRANTRTLANGVQTGGALPPSSKTAFNPSIAGRYTVSESLSVRGAAYRAFRAPGFNNLTRTFGTGTSTTIANPDLAPETLRGLEAGADYRTGPMTLGVSYFRYDIDSMIATFTARANSAPAQVQLICGGAALPTCGGAARYYTNDQDGRSHGLEAVASWRHSQHLAFDAQATYTSTYLTRRGAVVTDPLHVQLAGVPKLAAVLAATWSPREAWRLRLQARHTGGMYLDTTSSATARFSQGSNTIFDLSADYRWNKQLTVFARATNLLDRQYGEGTYTAAQAYSQTLSPPRAVSAGVRASF